MGMKAKRSKYLPGQESCDSRARRSFQFLHVSKTRASGKQAPQMLQLWEILFKPRSLLKTPQFCFLACETVSLHSGEGRSSLDEVKPVLLLPQLVFLHKVL